MTRRRRLVFSGMALVCAGCDLASRSVGEFVVPRPQSGEQAAADADGVSHLVAPKEAFDAIGLGDVDGDGYDDLAVVALSGPLLFHGPVYEGPEEPPTNAVYILYGRPDGLPAHAQLTSMADAVVTTARLGDFGVVPLGDVDGDGLDDVAISQEDSFLVDESEFDFGGGYLNLLEGRRDRLAGELLISELPELHHVREGRETPMAAGDFDGDGLADLWVQTFTPSSDTDDSKVVIRLFAGGARDWAQPLDFDAADAVLHEDDDTRYVVEGTGTPGGSAIGDFDADGFDDLALVMWNEPNGSPESKQRISIFYGRPSPSELRASAPDAWFESDALLYMGSGSGDLDGDSVDDIVAIQRIEDPQGPALVIEGSRARWNGALAIDEYYDDPGTPCVEGSSILGDVDGDGHRDIAAWSCGAVDPYVVGQELLFAYGWPDDSPTLRDSDIDAVFVAAPAYRMSSKSAGDFNGDGFDDYLIVSPEHDLSEATEIHLVYGAPRE